MKALDRPTDAAHEAPAEEGAGAVPRVLVAGALVVFAIGVVMRFWTRSDLWLDEALTVNIAKAPVSHLRLLLSHDGAPPVYYLLLHGWIRIFGTGDLAVRSLSGVFALATFPLAWRAGLRAGGPTDEGQRRVAAWGMVLLLAANPFAIHYATEARMYSLMVFEGLALWLAVSNLLESAEPRFAIATGAATAALLLTHYWSLYLLVVGGVALLWRWWRTAAGSQERRGTMLAIVAVAVGCVCFLPWAPTFLSQLRHTGTPWADPAAFSAIVNAIGEFAGGRSTSGRVLGLIFFALAGFGVFGAAIDERRIEIDLRTRPRGRAPAVLTAGTLMVAIAANLASGGGFAARYAAVVFPTFLVLAAIGLTSIADRWVRAGILAAACVAGLASATGNVVMNRTQQGIVASKIRAQLAPGDVVAYCPDQLGPATSRKLPSTVRQITYPRLTGPTYVDWVDYEKVNAAGDPLAFAGLADRTAGATGAVWYVMGVNYRTFGLACDSIRDRLGELRPGATTLVVLDDQKFFEHSYLVRFPPHAPTP